jgi:DNA-binding response OmpR family regulator
MKGNCLTCPFQSVLYEDEHLMQASPVISILVVEDDDQLLALIASVLEREHYAVYCAADGESALRVFRSRQQEISLVFTDLGLPQLTGLDLIRAIRLAKPDVRIIGVSAMGGKEIREVVKKAGATLFLPKPFHISEVVSSVKTVLAGSMDPG